MKKLAPQIDPNSTYHAVRIKAEKGNKEKVLEQLQMEQDVEYMFSKDFMKAIRAYGTHKRVKVRGWA